MKMKNKFQIERIRQNRFKGYSKVPKALYSYLGDKLNDSETHFLLVCFNILVDWDSKSSHKLTFGSFNYSNEVLAGVLNKSPSTISRLKNSLLAKGFLYKRLDGAIAFKCFGLIKKNNSKCTVSMLHDFYSNTISNNSEVVAYFSKMNELVNIEFFEYEDIPTFEGNEDLIKALSISFKGDIGKESIDIDYDEVDRFINESLEKGGVAYGDLDS